MTGSAALFTALPIGIAFGFLLERAGLGDPRVIAGQFTGRNFAVLRVMFGAILTAMLGVVWLDRAGALDLQTVAIPPTDIAGQAIGAVIFGGGFAIAALCPGTACVAAATGRREGLAAIVGLLVGTASTALAWPLVDGIVGVDVREGARLPDAFGVSPGIVVLGVAVLAVGALVVARRMEGERGAWRIPTGEAVALALALAFLAVDGDRFGTGRGVADPRALTAIAGEISREADHIDALELAARIMDGETGLRIVDVTEDTGAYVIPGSESVTLEELSSLQVAPGTRLVLTSAGGTHAAQAWVLLRAAGVENVVVLKDGLAAWEDEVMRPVAPPASAPDSARERYACARALSLYFGGAPRSAGSPAETVPRIRRRNTC